jgi:hypothetical protein
MNKSALAKTVDPTQNEAPDDRAALRDVIAAIIRREYSGDVCTEFWRAPARRAADRIVEILYSRH